MLKSKNEILDETLLKQMKKSTFNPLRPERCKTFRDYGLEWSIF